MFRVALGSMYDVRSEKGFSSKKSFSIMGLVHCNIYRLGGNSKLVNIYVYIC